MTFARVYVYYKKFFKPTVLAIINFLWLYCKIIFFFFYRGFYNEYTFSFIFKRDLRMTIQFFIYCYYLLWAELWCIIVWGFLSLRVQINIQFLYYRAKALCSGHILFSLQTMITRFIWYWRIFYTGYKARLETNRWHRVIRHFIGWILVYSYF